jgi:uncharacterized protein (TIGR03067 family)
MMSRHFLLLTSLTLALAAPELRAQDTTTTDALKKFQGTWTSKSDTNDGSSYTWVFYNDKLTLTTPTQKYVLRFTLTPTASSSGSIDLEGDPADPNTVSENKVPGIYQFDGTWIKICLAEENANRPTAFETKAGVSTRFDLKSTSSDDGD